MVCLGHTNGRFLRVPRPSWPCLIEDMGWHSVLVPSRIGVELCFLDHLEFFDYVVFDFLGGTIGHLLGKVFPLCENIS